LFNLIMNIIAHINSALSDVGASFASKHVVTIVFVCDSLHNMEVLSPPSKLRNLA